MFMASWRQVPRQRLWRQPRACTVRLLALLQLSVSEMAGLQLAACPASRHSCRNLATAAALVFSGGYAVKAPFSMHFQIH